MSPGTRSTAYRVTMVLLGLSVLLMLAGQSMSLVDYDLTVRLGLQESVEEVGLHGVEVGRAFGFGDTVVYVPLMVLSMIGLRFRRRWALATIAAVAGISAYWTTTIASMLAFLPGVPGYNFRPGPEIYAFIGVYMVLGVLGLTFVCLRGESLLK